MSTVFHTDISHLADVIGWTIIHSVWQITLVSIVLGMMLRMFRNHASRIKYNVACLGLIISLVWVGYTFINQGPGEVHSNQYKSITENRPFLADRLVGDARDRMDEIWMGARRILWDAQDGLSENAGIVSLIWFFGAIFFLIRFMGGMFYSRMLLFHQKRSPSDRLLNIIKPLSERMQVRWRVRIFESFKVTIPMVVGALKPVILVPVGFMAGIPVNQVEAILAHELAHVKRLDYLVNIFQSIIEVIFFYHPAVWWMSSVIRREREHCCDDLALSMCDGKLTYIKALSNIQNTQHQNKKVMVAFSSKKYQLLERIHRLLNKDQKRHSQTILLMVFLLALAGLLALKPVPGEFMLKGDMEPSNSKAFSGMSMAGTEPVMIPGDMPESKWIIADTVKKEQKRGHEEVENENGKEDGLNLEMDFDYDFDFDFDISEWEFSDTIHMDWDDFYKHFDQALSHIEFDFPDIHMPDSFDICWDEWHQDIQDAFLDVQHDIPRMEWVDTIEIDKEALRKQMDELRHKMEDFNSDQIQQQMKRARMDIQKSLEQIQLEMKQFREEEWPKLREEIRNALEEQRKQEVQKSDSLKLHTMGLSRV